MSKMNLTEATILALQGKLDSRKPSKKEETLSKKDILNQARKLTNKSLKNYHVMQSDDGDNTSVSITNGTTYYTATIENDKVTDVYKLGENKECKTESIDINVNDTTAVSVENDETVVDTEDATIVVNKKDGIEEPKSIEVPIEGNETIIPEDEINQSNIEQPVDSVTDIDTIDTELPVDLDNQPENDTIDNDSDLPITNTEDDTEDEENEDEDIEESKKPNNEKIQKIFENRKTLGKTLKKESFDKDDLELTEEQMWDYLLTYGVSEETLQVVTNINGYSRETLNDVLYAVTSYRSFKQYMEAEDPESYEEYFGDKTESKKIESKEQVEKGEVPDETYTIYGYIMGAIKGKDSITREEFDNLLDEAKQNVKYVEYDDLENDVRGLLSYSGYATIYEGDNEGGLSVVKESVEIEISDDGKEVEVTTDNGEEVEVEDETPDETETTEENIPEEIDNVEVPEETNETDETEMIETKKEKPTGICRKAMKENKLKSVKLEHDAKSFNRALSTYFKKNDSLIENVQVRNITGNNKNIKIEATIVNKDSTIKDVCLEMQQIKTNKNFTRYLQENKNTKNVSMLTFKNKQNILECRYINIK